MGGKIRGSIRNKLICAMVGITVVSIGIVASILYAYFSHSLYQYASNNNLQIVRQLNDNIEQNLAYMNDISILTVNDQDVIRYLQTDTDVSRDTLDNEYRILSQLGNLLDYSSHVVKEIYVYKLNDDENIGINRSSFDQERTFTGSEEWYTQLKDSSSFRIFFIEKLPTGETDYCIARKIVDPKTEIPIGIVVVGSPTSTIANLAQSYHFGDKWRLQIMDSTGDMFFSTNPRLDSVFLKEASRYNGKEMSLQTLAGTKYLTSSLESEYADWKITCFIPLGFVNKGMNRIILVVVGLIAGCILLFIPLSLILVHTITSPLVQLADTMNQVKDGHMDVHVEIGRHDEIGLLAQVFNEMIAKINRLISTTYTAQLREKDATIKSLLAQINPHFLYNTLESIRSLAILNDDYDTAKMIAVFGKFLRFKISPNGHYATVEQEMQNIEDYICLINMRNNGNIRVSFHVDGRLARQKIPKLMVQPIVENSVIHAFQSGKTPGTIVIEGIRQDTVTRIRVADDGMGIPEEKLAGICAALACEKEDLSESIGLRNVNTRIRLEFGDEYGLKIIRLEHGTSVEIILPPLDKGDGSDDTGSDCRR